MKTYRIACLLVPLALMGATGTASAQSTITTIETRREPLVLSPNQRTVIYRTVKRDSTVVVPRDVTIRRGATVPSTVVLSPLPESVYVDVPALTQYKYFYVNNQLVLVDPRTSEVVDIIDE
jgi:hypothetical protein